ncbi:thioredoxin-like domain-containing protein [Calycina marina]|uniref:protein disulfide-isomerase n=1 Tax=Calycina marina TaxID=1763456 RepID=A0A9P8CDX1_9HELO|nr:thioredoxin-like domain-containing protein [Calycina marina]
MAEGGTRPLVASLEPEWLSATAETSKQLLSIDCTVSVEFCEEADIISYPTIRWMGRTEDKIEMSRYRGPRRAAAIVSFARRTMTKGLVYVQKDQLKSFKTSDDVVFLLNPGGADDRHLRKNYHILASRHTDRFTFGIADKALDKSEVVAPGTVVRYMTNEEPKLNTGEVTLSALERFVEAASAPAIGQVTRRNEMKYLKSGKSIVYIFATTDAERSAFKSSLRSLARQFEEYLSFVTVDAVEYADMAPGLGLKPGVFPALAVQNPRMGQMFPYQQGAKITEQAVNDFVMAIVQGQVRPMHHGQAPSHDEL